MTNLNTSTSFFVVYHEASRGICLSYIIVFIFLWFCFYLMFFFLNVVDFYLCFSCPVCKMMIGISSVLLLNIMKTTLYQNFWFALCFLCRYVSIQHNRLLVHECVCMTELVPAVTYFNVFPSHLLGFLDTGLCSEWLAWITCQRCNHNICYSWKFYYCWLSISPRSLRRLLIFLSQALLVCFWISPSVYWLLALFV